MASLNLDHFRAATAAEVRELDRLAIEKFGLPGVVLMENAGREAANIASRLLSKKPNRKQVIIICGKGNNGGDGYVSARHLMNDGYQVTVFLTHHPDEIKGDAKIHLEVLKKMKGASFQVLSNKSNQAFTEQLSSANLVIDAILGTGLSKPVRPPLDETIRSINHSKSQVLSIDIPSGLDSDTGEVLGECVRADLTVTFVLPKKGLFLATGPEMVGQVILTDIGLPFELTQSFRLEPN